MKRLFLTLFFLLFTTSSFAAELLRFGWTYPSDPVDGFKLYRDGSILEQVTIPPTARTVTVPRQTDKKSHAYHLTAFLGEIESGPSDVAIDTYTPKPVARVEGTITIEIINQ
jgi:hypothetical protein